jgi:FKBP-type peptidyl-prolyl cis-trans isomerase (trigger factor)
MTKPTTKSTKKPITKKPVAKKASTLKDGSIKLKIKIKKEDVARAYGQILIESAKHVEIKGFRKGKAPIKMVEASLDPSKLYSRVINVVVPPMYSDALKKGNHRPLIDPSITPIKMEEGKDWEFEIETAEAPEVKVGEYKKYIKSALTKARKEHKEPKKGEEAKADQHWELNTVLDAILKNSQVEPSPALIKHESDASIHKLEHQLTSLKLSVDDYLKSIKKTREDMEKEYSTTAKDNIRLEFSLKAITETENPEVTAKEVQDAKPPQGQEAYVRYLLQKQKVLDILVKL